MELTIIHDSEILVFTVPDDAQCQYSLVCTSTPVTVIPDFADGWSQTGWLAICQECKDFYDRMVAREMPKKKFDEGEDNITQIHKDDVNLKKASEKKHTGDRAADALSDLARDVDSE